MTEKVLDYSRKPFGDYDGGVFQTKPWDCGPASVQVILQSAGVVRSEQWIIDHVNASVNAADRITTNGTNHAGILCPILNELLPGSGYTEVWLPREPVSKKDIDLLWKNISRSIDSSRGVLLNFEVPPWAQIKTSRGSTPPPYPTRSTTFHYTACMGKAEDADGSRHGWIADPAGFGGVTGYWVPIEEIARLVVPHAYAYAAGAPIVITTPPTPVIADNLATLWMEWNALEFGDLDAIGAIVKLSQSGDIRAAKSLARLEQTNPDSLRKYINRQKVTA